MEATVKTILDQFVEELSEIFKDKLKQVILFGSYARGDFEEYSDIDVMILVDMRNEEIEKLTKEVVKTSCELDSNYDTLLSPIIKDIRQFEEWLPVLLFYKNVVNEGVIVYG